MLIAAGLGAFHGQALAEQSGKQADLA